MAGIEGTDMLLLCGLIVRDPRQPATVRKLGKPVGLGPSVVQRSLARLERARLLLKDRTVNFGTTEEFFFYGLRYVFPAELGERTHGVATAASLYGLFPDDVVPAEDEAAVWPHGGSCFYGCAIEPLTPRTPEIAAKNKPLHELLALLDCIRTGSRRVHLARDELSRRLRAAREREVAAQRDREREQAEQALAEQGWVRIDGRLRRLDELERPVERHGKTRGYT
jgi:hypothetical protein